MSRVAIWMASQVIWCCATVWTITFSLNLCICLLY